MSGSRIQLRRQSPDAREWVGTIEPSGSVKITEGRIGKTGRSKVVGPNSFQPGKDARGELLDRARAKIQEGYESVSWQVEQADDQRPDEDFESFIYFSVAVLTGFETALPRVFDELIADENSGLAIKRTSDIPARSYEIDLGVTVTYDPLDQGAEMKAMASRDNELAMQFFGLLARAQQRLGITVKAADDQGEAIDPSEFYTPGTPILTYLSHYAYAIGALAKPLVLNPNQRNGQTFQAVVF